MCWKLGLKINSIGFLASLGQYSQIWGLAAVKKRVTPSIYLGSSSEKPRRTPEVGSVLTDCTHRHRL